MFSATSAASAVQAGTYAGVSACTEFTQAVYISQTVITRGSYTTTNWTTPDSTSNLTTLDAQGQGRVMVITGLIAATVEGLRVTGGNATGAGYCSCAGW